MRDPTPYAYLLWALSALFLLRVLGQIVVVLLHPRWLPSMGQWYSGLIPYRFLLPIQLLILTLMGAICRDFSSGRGFFVAPKPTLGPWVVWYSYLYFGSMVVRYIVSMKGHPERRWRGGTIPIALHCVLAGFLYVVGRYHAP